MHIALLTDGVSPFVTGGMQRHSWNLVRNLLKKNVEVTLVHTVPYGELPAEAEVKNRIEEGQELLHVIAIPFPKTRKVPGHYLKDSYRYSCAIFEKLKDQWSEFDFIYSKGFTAWCLLEHKKKGMHMAPVGVKFHGYEMFQKAAGLKMKLTQYLLRPPVVYINRNADVVFSYGGEITEIIAGTGVDRSLIVEIGSGVDSSWILDAPASTGPQRDFLFIGRNERRKGIPELESCKSVFDETGTRLHWIGPVSHRAVNKDKSQIYHGEVRETVVLQSLIDQCRVLIVPSYSEGMPNVILEAMARGMAIIATRVGAIPNMVTDQNAILIEPGNISMLRTAIREMATMPDAQLCAMQKASIERVRSEFRWEVIADKTIRAIRNITFSSENKV